MEHLKQIVTRQIGRTLESPADYEYLSEQIQKENESKLRTMQFELEREHNANIHLHQSINPLNNTPSSYHTAEDQRY